MPTGYSAQCKACNSKQRAEIDRRLLAGESSRAVSAWLASAGETISHVGLTRHKASHLNVVEEAKARIAEATPVFEEGVQRVVAEASLLDEIASVGMRVARGLEKAVTAGPSMAQATAFGMALREARTAVVAKHELLHGKKLNVEGFPDPGADALAAKLAALVGEARGEADPGTDRGPQS
jgi:hypothetical protein